MPDWHPIDDDTPRDRPVLILAPAMDGLPDLVALTTWHPSAGDAGQIKRNDVTGSGLYSEDMG